MSAESSYFQEAAGMLGWRSYRGVAMLWGFFDESNIHDCGGHGHAVRCVMGGCVAPADVWLSFIPQWSDVLRKAKIPMFHMADFEKGVGDYKGWDDTRKAETLDPLLEIMVNNVKGFFGTYADIEPDRVGKHNKSEYRKLVIDTMRAICLEMGFRQHDKVAVVFARHQDFSLDRVQAYRAVLESNDSVFGPIKSMTQYGISLCKPQIFSPTSFLAG